MVLRIFQKRRYWRRYNKACRSYSFQESKQKLTFTDLIRGEITFDTTELGDFVVARSMTEPVYHMAVVVDDFEGWGNAYYSREDHISNTPRQILILRALGAPRQFTLIYRLFWTVIRPNFLNKAWFEGFS